MNPRPEALAGGGPGAVQAAGLDGYGGFSVGGMALALPMAALREVVPGGPLQPLPAQAPCVAGALLVRGVLVPVLDLLVLLDRGRCDPLQSRVVMLVWQGRLLGLLADGVSGVFQAEPGQLHRMQAEPGGGAGAVLCGSLGRADGGGTVALLSPQALMDLPGVPRLDDPEPGRAVVALSALADAAGAADAVEGAPGLPGAAAHRQLMLVRCGRLVLALEAMAVHATHSELSLAASALALGACRGVADLGGLPVAMVDLAELCGLERLVPRTRWQAMLVRAQSGLVGLLVDEVIDVLRVDPAAMLPAPAFALPRPALFEGVLPLAALPGDAAARCGVDTLQCLVLNAGNLAAWPELDSLAEALGSRWAEADATAQAGGGRQPVITFELGCEVAAPIEHISEILPLSLQAGAFGQAVPQLLGMVSLRGRCIPVMCLHGLCDLVRAPQTPGQQGQQGEACVLVVQAGEHWLGLAVPRLLSIDAARPLADLPVSSAGVLHRQPMVSLGHGATERLAPVLDLQALAARVVRGEPALLGSGASASSSASANASASGPASPVADAPAAALQWGL